MNVGQAHRPLVVGVDGSGSGYGAVEWAAAEAARRGATLRLVRAFSWTTSDRPVGGQDRAERYRDQLLDIARGQLARAARVAAATRPDVVTVTQVEVAAPIEALVAEARRAQLVVLGDRGLGGLAGLVLGSVSVSLAAHGACPVVIVRGERGRTGSIPGDGTADPVVVGIDGSPVSEAALAFGFDAAAARGVGLVAVHAWSPTVIDEALAPLLRWDPVEEEATLAERLAGWGQKYPQVAVQRTVVRDGAVRALVDASRRAQLVVVGSRGRGNAAGLFLGSVSHGVLHGAHCPVAVVRPGTDS